MHNDIATDLRQLAKTNPLSVDDGVRAKINAIITHCNKYYYDHSFYGHAALNRKILLDPVVAENLTSDVIQAIMSNSPELMQLKRTTRTGKIIDTAFKDVLLHCFSEGLLAIKHLPNNEREYDTTKYNEQQRCFEQNTRKILSEIQKAVGSASSYAIPSLPYPSVIYFKKSCLHQH